MLFVRSVIHCEYSIFTVRVTYCDVTPLGARPRGNLGDTFHVWERAIFPTFVWSTFHYLFKFKIRGR